mgnify:FL=1
MASINNMYHLDHYPSYSINIFVAAFSYLLSLVQEPLGAPQELTWKQKCLVSLWYLGSDSSYRLVKFYVYGFWAKNTVNTQSSLSPYCVSLGSSRSQFQSPIPSTPLCFQAVQGSQELTTLFMPSVKRKSNSFLRTRNK